MIGILKRIVKSATASVVKGTPETGDIHIVIVEPVNEAPAPVETSEKIIITKQATEGVNSMNNDSIKIDIQAAAAETLAGISAVQRFLITNRCSFRSVLGFDKTDKMMNNMHGAVFALAYYGKKISRGFSNSLEYVAKQNFEHLPCDLQLARLDYLNQTISALMDNDSKITMQTRCKNLADAFMIFHKPELSLAPSEKVCA